MKQTATVEALTAEVRVLMVGSRQITLSVARQLDVLDELSAIEVFGRVRLGDDKPRVIGADKATGELKLALFKFPHGPVITAEDIDKPIIICDTTRGNQRDHAYFLRYEDEATLTVDPRATQSCGKHAPDPMGGRFNGVCGWDPNGNEPLIKAQIAEWQAARRVFDAAASAPLIVLAGLR